MLNAYVKQVQIPHTPCMKSEQGRDHVDSEKVGTL